MRFRAVVMAFLMVAAAGAQAQQVNAKDPQIPTQMQKNTAIRTEQQQKAVIILHSMGTVLNGSECPGALQARQQATGGATVWTTALGDDSAAWARPGGLGIHVEFEGRNTAVKSLELQVSYLPLGLHAMLVAPRMTNTATGQPRERTKTFNLDRVAAMRIGADLLVGPAATITRVHLVSVMFADGSVWHAPNEDACTVVPSRIMLVADK
jgi:hypothetical protein